MKAREMRAGTAKRQNSSALRSLHGFDATLLWFRSEMPVVVIFARVKTNFRRPARPDCRFYHDCGQWAHQHAHSLPRDG